MNGQSMALLPEQTQFDPSESAINSIQTTVGVKYLREDKAQSTLQQSEIINGLDRLLD